MSFLQNLLSILNFRASGRSRTAVTSKMELFCDSSKWLETIGYCCRYLYHICSSPKGRCWQRSLIAFHHSKKIWQQPYSKKAASCLCYGRQVKYKNREICTSHISQILNKFHCYIHNPIKYLRWRVLQNNFDYFTNYSTLDAWLGSECAFEI